MVKVYRPRRGMKRGQKYQPMIRKNKSRRTEKVNTRSLITSSDYGFPDKLRTKLRYVENVYLTANTTYSFRLNSVYDPNLSGVGHKPLYHDQFSALYGKYRVLGSKIIARVSKYEPPATVTANHGPTFCGLVCSPNSTITSSTIQTRSEENNNAVKMLGDKSGGTDMVTLVQTFSPARDLGNGAIDDSNAASVNNNPAQVFYAHLWLEDIVAPATTDVVVNVTIEYFVEYFQRAEIASS